MAKAKATTLVPCDRCGVEFSPRGIKRHREACALLAARGEARRN